VYGGIAGNYVAKTGDTMTGSLIISGASSNLSVGGAINSLSGAAFLNGYAGDPNSGVMFLGNSNATYLYYTSGRFLLEGAPLFVTNTTASSSPSTGALVVAGGVGVGKELQIGGTVLAVTGVAAGLYFKNSGGTLYPGISVAGSGHYTILAAPDSNPFFQGGDTTDPTNYYNNTTHIFTNRANNVNFATLNVTGLNVAGAVTLRPPALITPAVNGEMTFQLTSNTALAIKVKGSDGTVRTATLTLA